MEKRIGYFYDANDTEWMTSIFVYSIGEAIKFRLYINDDTTIESFTLADIRNAVRDLNPDRAIHSQLA
ncbi:MAG: hypothetical protein AAFX95_15435 [Cyanobacteria bacterium J06639_16]